MREIIYYEINIPGDVIRHDRLLLLKNGNKRHLFIKNDFHEEDDLEIVRAASKTALDLFQKSEGLEVVEELQLPLPIGLERVCYV